MQHYREKSLVHSHKNLIFLDIFFDVFLVLMSFLFYEVGNDLLILHIIVNYCQETENPVVGMIWDNISTCNPAEKLSNESNDPLVSRS